MKIMGNRSPTLAIVSAITMAMVSALPLVSAFQSTSNQNQHSPPTSALPLTPNYYLLSPLPSSSSSSSSTTALYAWNREHNGSGGGGGGGLDGGGGILSNRGRQQRPLRAYTVADNVGKPAWFPFFKFPLPFADAAAQFFGLEDSLFSFEGGGVTGVTNRPYMSNLELEEETATVSSTIPQGLSIIDVNNNNYNNAVILSELDALTETFADLESSMDYRTQLYEKTILSYECKVNALEEKNMMLEAGLQKLTLALDKQEKQLLELRQVKGEPAAIADVDKTFDVDFLLQGQGNVQTLEDENSSLRQRIRSLELALSEAAYESRKVMPAPIVAIAPSSTLTGATEASDFSANTVKLLPKAPSVPVPDHILQQQLGQLHMQQNSVGHGLRNGIKKMRRALNFWNPAYNLMLWGELKGH